jgi:hypothetical protein
MWLVLGLTLTDAGGEGLGQQVTFSTLSFLNVLDGLHRIASTFLRGRLPNELLFLRVI